MAKEMEKNVNVVVEDDVWEDPCPGCPEYNTCAGGQGDTWGTGDCAAAVAREYREWLERHKGQQ